MGGQLYDWGLSFAVVAVIGAGYLVVCGEAVKVYSPLSWAHRFQPWRKIGRDMT
jgi:hypothetical protein